jgi:1,4-dihydroxy-2-naphthoyl-CoA hydrolase
VTAQPHARPEIRGFDPGDDFTVDRSPFGDLIGLEWDLLSPERIEAHLDIDERHHQPYGIVHGGVYASIVETVGSVGAAVNVHERGKIVVGVNNSTDFLRAHREGRLDVVGTPLHAGRLQQLWAVDITRADGKTVARGQLRLQVLDPDRI